jgi:hypothetical protein
MSSRAVVFPLWMRPFVIPAENVIDSLRGFV